MRPSQSFPVILPSETQSREFDGKLLLAGLLAKRGHPVYVGSRIEIHNRIHTLPRGLYLAKDVRRSSRRMFRIMDQLGFAIAAWDEEAIIIADVETFHKRRVDPESLNHIKAFFAQGSKNREIMETAPGYRDTPIYETGNPRFDMLGPRCRGFFAPQVEALRDRFGEFILINSNFGSLNHVLPNQAAVRTAGGGFKNLAAGTDEWWTFRFEVLNAFKALLPELGRAFPDRQIVLRPHPGEGLKMWQEAAQGLPNITVIHEGNVYPWILASAVAIHNGCTTGLESYMMDHAVVAYHPVVSEAFDDQLPNKVSAPVYSKDELIATLRDIFAGKSVVSVPDDIRRQVEWYVGPLGDGLASERIGALIEEHGPQWVDRDPSLPTRVAGYAHAVGRQAVKTVNSYRAGHKNSQVYNDHRFPGLDRQAVNDRLERLSKVTGCFSDLSVSQIHRNIFCIENSRPA